MTAMTRSFRSSGLANEQLPASATPQAALLQSHPARSVMPKHQLLASANRNSSATGRPVAGLPATATNGFELHRAARFFVRTVMLRPGSDPFTLLGLPPDFEPTQLREHYRLMIRLTHPDFCATGEGWPADAATRVNLAHDLLSSPAKRAAYTAALHTRLPMRPRLSRP